MAKNKKKAMLTTPELNAFIGMTGLWTMPIGVNFVVRVSVIDARQIFGRVELKVTAGGTKPPTGWAWAARKSVELFGEAKNES